MAEARTDGGQLDQQFESACGSHCVALPVELDTISVSRGMWVCSCAQTDAKAAKIQQNAARCMLLRVATAHHLKDAY